MNKYLYGSKRLCIILLCVLLALCPISTGASAKIAAAQILNLQKLCKVWGYAKYTHPVFLSGEKDWDEELLNLYDPVIGARNAEEANDILYDWFIALGEVDYGSDFYNLNWVNASDDERFYLAETDWISDSFYLGQNLSSALLQLGEIPVVYRRKAPVHFPIYFPKSFDFNDSGFSNEKIYEEMNYADTRYRILALFRLWNAMEYYYPYRNALDDDWNEVLLNLIPEMLEGTNRHSYQLTLAKLASKLHDAHVNFTDRDFLLDEFGQYGAPVGLVWAENQLAVRNIYEDCALQPGDVILDLNGISIWDIVSDRKQYVSVTADEKLMNNLAYLILRSHDSEMVFTIIRQGIRQTIAVGGIEDIFYSVYMPPNKSHVLLEENIGLLNPALLSSSEVSGVMNEFADTFGIIVDLRQYPGLDSSLCIHLMDYFVNSDVTYALTQIPSEVVPGAYIQIKERYIEKNPKVFYDKPVAILINENTQSFGEYYAMALRLGPNVTVIGQNSVGSDGNLSILPLPDGNMLMFSGDGVLTPDGEQTQRIGISPDIYVEPTIQGIREGRDELMEAVIAFILDKQ